MKRMLMLALCALLCLGLSVTAFAARDCARETEYAAVPRTLGLFRGVSENHLELDRAPTRVEALVMLIRLLGQEDEALAAKHTHPFTDVPAWADDYVGYAYATGLTKGSSPAHFGAGEASAANYLTFVLRALGYSDADGDFPWDDPFVLAKSVGILPEDIDLWHFWRADVCAVSYAALTAKYKASDATLADKLIADGAFSGETFGAAYRGPIEPGLLSDDYTPAHPNGFDFTASPASTYLRLGQYKGFTVSVTIAEVTEEEIDDFILEYGAELAQTEVDRACALGDAVAIDFVGTENGVAFAGGSGSVDALVLGSGKMIPGFEEGIVGMKAGETKTITVTFPENYYAELAGHTVQFEIAVKSVKAVSRDAAAAEVRASHLDAANEQALRELFAMVGEKATFFAYPFGMADDIVYAAVDYAKTYATMYGLSYEDFVKMATDEDALAYEANVRTAAKENIFAELMIHAVAQAEGMTVSEAEYDEQIARYLAQYQVADVQALCEAAEVSEAYLRSVIRYNLLRQKVIAFFYAENTVVAVN